MDQERDEVREVEQARSRVAEDVRNVAENANVVQRTKENVQDRIDDVKSTMSDRVSDVRDKLSDARDTIADSIGNVNPVENPMAMLLGGLAIGFLIGMILPVTRFESERIGPITDDVKDRVRAAGGEAVRRGSEVIKDTIEATKEAAATSLKEQARDFGSDSGGSGGTTPTV
ncbi:MAG: hypothetical protein ABR508_12235 [Candidatus Baltobacteraceae bacterium]